MTDTAAAASAPSAPPAALEEVQKQWRDLVLEVRELKTDAKAQEQINKALRQQLETVIEHRQKSHSELVILLTNLVTKLPLKDVGVIVAKLIEHNVGVSNFLSSLVKGGSGDP